MLGGLLLGGARQEVLARLPLCTGQLAGVAAPPPRSARLAPPASSGISAPFGTRSAWGSQCPARWDRAARITIP